MKKAPITSRAILILLLLAVILVPFFLYGERIEHWTDGVVEAGAQRPGMAALILGGLLAGDILLPVPSSIVSTACGMLLGITVGVIVSWTGMMVSCVAGFWLARALGRPFVEKTAGTAEVARIERLNERFGAWAIIVARPIPVLAEASVLVVGLGALSFGRFVALAALSNLGVSLVYGIAGAYASDMRSFLPALAASIGLPWVLMALMRRRAPNPPDSDTRACPSI